MTIEQGWIGVDIGGTNTKIAWVDEKGHPSFLERVYTRDTRGHVDDFVQHILAGVNRVREQAGISPVGIGIASPGLQIPGGLGTQFSVNLPFLNGFSLKDFFSEKLSLPVVVNNDLVAHSLGEYRFGAGRGVERFLSVSLGTGIGHTYIENGQPQLTIHGVSGDSGRMILEVGSQICDSSGVYGSAEALCGVHAIEELAQGTAFSSAQEVINAAREQNDPTAQAILKVVSRRLAQLLVNLASIYFPQVIAITGGQTEAGPFFLSECQAEFDRLSNLFIKQYFRMTGQPRELRIVKAEAGGLAGLLGSIVPLLPVT